MTPFPSASLLVTTSQAASLLSLSKSHLEKLRFYEDPLGPPFIRIGRSIRYRTTDLEAWCAARIVGLPILSGTHSSNIRRPS